MLSEKITFRINHSLTGTNIEPPEGKMDTGTESVFTFVCMLNSLFF